MREGETGTVNSLCFCVTCEVCSSGFRQSSGSDSTFTRWCVSDTELIPAYTYPELIYMYLYRAHTYAEIILAALETSLSQPLLKAYPERFCAGTGSCIHRVRNFRLLLYLHHIVRAGQAEEGQDLHLLHHFRCFLFFHSCICLGHV